MTRLRSVPVLSHLRGIRTGATTKSLSDRELLERFIGREQSAFVEIVQRHGPLVWSVCMRVLGGSVADAEDVFQATFMVLARKAETIQNQESLSSWLYRVAYHTALDTRTAAWHRRVRDNSTHVENEPAVSTDDDAAEQKELIQLLDEELNQLPENQRAPLVLCYLQGKTHAEAAKELGWSRGSMAKRMSAALQRLKKRLEHRGVAVTATALALALTSSRAVAAAPASVSSATINAGGGAMAAPAIVGKGDGGFTLVDMLVAGAIILVLAGLGLVGIQHAQAAANQITTVNNLRNVGYAAHTYFLNEGQFPTEHGDNPSFYKTLLPYVEEPNAPDSIAIMLYQSPVRHGEELRARRDFGYPMSTAHGARGPSILDAAGGVSIKDITAYGKGVSDTAMLTMVWMAPDTYDGGDPTDAGWATKNNGRATLTATKQDSDSTGNSNYLGGPFDTLPVVFADGHVAKLPYVDAGINQAQQVAFARQWAVIDSVENQRGGMRSQRWREQNLRPAEPVKQVKPSLDVPEHQTVVRIGVPNRVDYSTDIQQSSLESADTWWDRIWNDLHAPQKPTASDPGLTWWDSVWQSK